MRGACCSHSSLSVVTGTTMAFEAFPNWLCAARAWPSIMVERPWKSFTTIESCFARRRADEGLEMPIARSHRPAQAREPGIRFNGDAAPSLEIERERHVVVDRVAGADVDIEPFSAAAEAAHEVKVLEPLGIGNGPGRGHVFEGTSPIEKIHAHKSHAEPRDVIYPIHRASAACVPQVQCNWRRSAART